MHKTMIIVSFALILLLTACTTNKEKKEYSIDILKSKIDLFIDESYDLEVNVTENGAAATLEVIYTIESGSEFITLNSKTIKGVLEGEAVVKVALKNQPNISDTITISVKSSLKIETPQKTTIDVGETLQLSATDLLDTEGKGVTWTSSNVSVATVEQNGMVTGVSNGEVDITVTSKTNNKTATIKINVVVGEISNIEIIFDHSEMLLGEAFLINSKISPAYMNQAVTYSVDVLGIVEIKGNQVKAVKEGNVKITATSVADSTKKATVTVKVNSPVQSISIDEFNEIVDATDTFKLTATLTPSNIRQDVIWTSSNEAIATIDNLGNVVTYLIGEVTFTATAVADSTKTATVTIKVNSPVESINIDEFNETVDVTDTFKLTAILTPSNISQDVIWTSSDEAIATIDNLGNVVTHMNGEVTFTASSKLDPNKQATLSVNVNLNPIKIMASLNVENPLRQYVTTFGYNPDQRQQWVNGSVNMYFNTSLNLIEKIVPINQNEYTGKVATPSMIVAAEGLKKVRPGILHPETKYIVYHDTGNHTPGADALMHANYLVGSDNANNRARSWHYTVDEKQIYHHIPDNEVAWQGDSFDAYAMAVGIETCVNYGSDLYSTWQRTAKLMAKILVEQNLNVDAIKQHYDFNQKNCPQTLRMSGLYGEAIDLVRAEYLVATLLKDYTITFTSLNENIVDNRGRVINAPEVATRVGYIVNVKGENYDESIVLYSVIKGIDGSTTVNSEGTEADFEKAKSFDLSVAAISKDVKVEDKATIDAARQAYDALTDVQKNLVTTLPLLEELEYKVLTFFKVDTAVVINEIMVSDNPTTKYGYIELYNPTSKAISLKDWTIQYSTSDDFTLDASLEDTSWYKFSDDAVIKAKGYFLIQFASGNNEGNKYLPLADGVTGIYIEKLGGKFALTNKAEVVTDVTNDYVVDFVGYGNITKFEGSVAKLITTIERRKSIDTNNNGCDFIEVKANPTNSNKQVLNQNPSLEYENAMAVDVLIISLPKVLTLEDESKVNEARLAYTNLTGNEKALVLSLELLEAKENEILALQNPDLVVIFNALKNVPNKIVNDFSFPQFEGLTWTFKETEASTYFNLETGKYIKLSVETKLFTITAKYNETSIDKVINFGILESGQKTVFSTATKAPAGGKTSEGFGTYLDQANAVGFSGVSITVGNKVYFIGKNAYIPLTTPKTTNLTIDELRPYGKAAVLYNQSIVNGVATDTAGTATLYYNATNQPLSFDPSFTYGRNNAAYAGYGKVVFKPNVDGTYTVQNRWLDSGGNDSTTGRIETLQPGEYLICPHTYDTNLNGGTWLMQEGTNGAVGVLAPGTIVKVDYFKVFN